MMDLLLATSGGESQSASGGYVDDVFSAYTYTGNGSTQTINNGIDLAQHGGLVWTKSRTDTADHRLHDTVRGVGQSLVTNLINENTNLYQYGVTAFGATGFSVSDSAGTYGINKSASNYASWTFRRAPKFFDVVTYTGNGASNRALSHQLNADVGMITVKATSTTGDWWVFHRSATGDLVLNTAAAQTESKANIPSATTSTFTVNGNANTNGVSYVAYLWAHDPSADGIIQCGSFTGNTTVNIGWEPQWIMIKRTDAAGDWIVIDSMRGCSVGGVDAVLNPNLSNAESVSNDYIDFTATGFITKNLTGTYIYTVIRRPIKPPTSGTQVYNAIAYTGNGVTGRKFTGVGFPFDAFLCNNRQGISNNTIFDRLRGLQILSTTLAVPETAGAGDVASFDIDGWTTGNAGGNRTNYNARTYINHFFRRTPGFFDVVCFNSLNSSSDRRISHNLGVEPELLIMKLRSDNGAWLVYSQSLGVGSYLQLNTTIAKATIGGIWGSGQTATTFGVSETGLIGQTGTLVAYLFASLPGISKVGSYTGNGSSQTIDCGFGTGARFVLIKRTDAAGDWYVWDSVRGIVAANDPHLSLNTTAAEVATDDSVDPDASGFIVNQNTATNINVNGGSYIFLAIA